MKRPHKYGAKATVVDGIRFASQKEARRYVELRLLQRVGKIHGLVLQPKYALCSPPSRFALVSSPLSKLGEYRADFAYCECPIPDVCQRTRVTVEDVKGFKTPLYKWKKRHVEAQYGITVVEV